MSTPGIRAAYSRFLDSSEGRILLSGHSHQAWPDVAREAQLEVFDDAARLVDDKWGRVFEIQNEVGRAVLRRLGFAEDDAIAFGESTHQLIYRLFSALDLERAHVVTTSGEFHSLYRQLARLSEDGLRVTWVDAHPRAGIAERLLDAIDTGVTVVALSAVLFEDAFIVPDLLRVIKRSREVGAIPLVDAYHAFNVLPLTWGAEADGVYVVAGGYKYAGIGNGLCWMRLPRDCALRPAYTGWFADFSSLAEPRKIGEPVAYGPGGMRFAGATFDASAMYRARAVMAHWDALGLDVSALRAISTSQTRRVMKRLEMRAPDVAIVSDSDDRRRAGFVTVRHDRAGDIVSKLRDRGVLVDSRGSLLRIGPAPYLLDEEIDRGVDIIAETISSL
jgi:selenocysteine lyase/cysteine desulfurase